MLHPTLSIDHHEDEEDEDDEDDDDVDDDDDDNNDDSLHSTIWIDHHEELPWSKEMYYGIRKEYFKSQSECPTKEIIPFARIAPAPAALALIEY